VQILVTGSLLSPARRTVAAALRVLGLAQIKQFHRYHRVLSQAKWSSLAISRILLGLLVAAFAPDGPLVVGIDDTLERRRGAKIAAEGIYHDAVRSSHSHFVTASGLRWICLMLLVPIPWAARTWALPVLTATAADYAALLATALSVPGLARRLGVDQSRVRQRIARHTLVAVKDGATWRLPLYQLDDTGQQLVPGLAAVAPHLAEVHPVVAASCFTLPHPDLADDDGRPVAPRLWLLGGGDSGEVALLADELHDRGSLGAATARQSGGPGTGVEGRPGRDGPLSCLLPGQPPPDHLERVPLLRAGERAVRSP